jgi:hypothetical protein
MSDKMVEEMARAIEPRAWEAFDGYVEVFAGALKGYTADQKREAFIYGSPLVKGHDWGRTLQHSLEAAQAAATIAERRMEEMRVHQEEYSDMPQDMGALLALAERCEQATGPDRDLDALIRCAVFAPQGAFVRRSPINGAWCIYEISYGGKERSWEPRGLSREARVGAFTASLDAAMTLVPEGFDWLIGRTNDGLTIHAEVGGRGDEFMRFGNTPALALCAAALRARASTKEQQP